MQIQCHASNTINSPLWQLEGRKRQTMKHLYLKSLCFCLFLFFGTNAFAYDALVNGIYYNFSGTEATVTYREYSSNSYSGNVVIPSSVVYGGMTYSVTCIGDSAFYSCSSLTSVTIPNNVTDIGDRAFLYCI